MLGRCTFIIHFLYNYIHRDRRWNLSENRHIIYLTCRCLRMFFLFFIFNYKGSPTRQIHFFLSWIIIVQVLKQNNDLKPDNVITWVTFNIHLNLVSLINNLAGYTYVPVDINDLFSHSHRLVRSVILRLAS